jgi:hypothetical protein
MREKKSKATKEKQGSEEQGRERSEEVEGKKIHTVFCPRCSRTRPWHVRICAPARSSICAYCTVFSMLGKMRNLAVTGTARFLWRVFTVSPLVSLGSSPKKKKRESGESNIKKERSLRVNIKSQSSCKKAPYRPLRAMSCGHPRLISTPSQCRSTTLAEVRRYSGSLAQNCTMSGRSVEGCPSSPEGMSKNWLRYFFVESAKSWEEWKKS